MNNNLELDEAHIFYFRYNQLRLSINHRIVSVLQGINEILRFNRRRSRTIFGLKQGASRSAIIGQLVEHIARI